jgi:endoglucanase
VNWYGAEEKDFVVAGLDKKPRVVLAHTIKTLGFNAVRLPWSNELVETDPIVDSSKLTANADLMGSHALDVLDAVIGALSDEGLLVILDNHTSNADWCCTTSDGNGLWHNAQYPEAKWIADWQTMANRYQSFQAVLGADLRNELRQAGGVDPTWGTGNPAPDGTDWRAAAIRGANAVLAIAPRWLVFVEGLSFAGDLSGAYGKPILDADLAVPHRLVYEAHNYSNYVANLTSYSQLKTELGNKWGFLLVQNMPFTAPVWVGEFGTCNTANTCAMSSNTADQGFWFQALKQYLHEADIDWAYWPLNGTEATGNTRTFGATETYGLLKPDWATPSNGLLLDTLQSIQAVTQGP